MAFLATPLVFPLGGGGYVATSADVWGRDLLAIVFAEPMRVDALLRDRGAYSIVDPDGNDPEVRDVFVGHDAATTQIWLETSPLVVGTTYAVQYQNLYAVTGLGISPTACEFIGRETKIDSIVDARPRMYDVRARARYRWLLNAIGREDDLIGGSRSDRFTIVEP